MIEIIFAAVITLAVIVGFIIYTFNKLLLVATPNQVMVLAGGTHSIGNRKVGYRAIRGGRAVRLPLVEEVHWMDLSNIPVDIVVRHAFSKGGIPLNVEGVAHVKLPGSEPRLSNAIERFLGRSRAEIAQVARETLEGNVRGVLAQLTPEQVNEDKVAFANQLLEEAEHDFMRMGLVLDTLKIQNVTDDSNYLNSIGRIRGASIRRDASIAEARAEAEAAIQKASNWGASELAKIKANLAIAHKETERRVKAAVTGRETKIKEAEGKVRAEIAKIQEDIHRQGARAPQVERQLHADVVEPWTAECRKMEEQARARAASIVERGRAEAEALASLVQEYSAAGDAAREVLVLQQLMPMLNAISGAQRPTRINEWTVLGSEESGDGMAHKAIRFNEQIRAATGVNLAEVAGRLGSGSGGASAPSKRKLPPKS
ncbi:MAG: flotillin family protein [Myxococcales bacterium]|nr:flotillin family protein [Myxococcales bacterium]